METVKIEVQHAEHREWLNKIDFYYDDLKIMRHRLEEVAARNTDKSLMAQVEHFQNQFVIQRNELDGMKHAIHQAESGIAENVAQNGTAVLMATHDIFRAKEVANRIGIMKGGNLVSVIDAKEISANELEKLYLQTV